jgi:hypothetical protein
MKRNIHTFTTSDALKRGAGGAAESFVAHVAHEQSGKDAHGSIATDRH